MPTVKIVRLVKVTKNCRATAISTKRAWTPTLGYGQTPYGISPYGLATGPVPGTVAIKLDTKAT